MLPTGKPKTSETEAAAPRDGPPSVSLPKGGGAIQGIGEKFAANPVTGTGSMTVPLATSPGRAGFGPQLALSYDSGNGNGPFGFGWSLSLPAITRKTDKGLPQYRDAEESDVYILSGVEDLVPVLHPDGTRFEDGTTVPGYTIRRYCPRVEGLFARIERWTNQITTEISWRSITRDNVTTIYGKTDNSRIADPSDSKRVFAWLISESYDDKGNASFYTYAPETDDNIDRTQANERNRVRTAHRYLKSIQYGNETPRQPNEDLSLRANWMFEVIFDYEEDYYEELPLDSRLTEDQQNRFVLASALPGSAWALRPDPFSSYRSGFEVRKYRRCRRVLMFHRFAELGTGPCLVRSTEFEFDDLDYAQPVTIESELSYQGSTRFASFIRSITQSGFLRDDTQAVVQRNGVSYVTYLKKSLPPLEFEYSKAVIQDDIRELDAGSLENLPVGLDGGTYQWVDLDGEGVSGILREQADAWFYKPSLGDGRFGPLRTVSVKPSLAALSGGRQQLLDLAGDGHLDLAAFAGPTPGFYKRTDDENWESFRTFNRLPNIQWDEPNLRFVDLDGDGHADVLITEQEVFTWYPSLAEEGFDRARRVYQPQGEESGPQLIFDDGTQSIYLADMSGDGLSDLVRIRNGEICYWPNIGYGRFGAKVTMDNPPWFDNPDQFSQSGVRLADIDGSGTSDIIYLSRDGARLYFNQSGNRWSDPRSLVQFPRVDNLSSVMTADLLGNGTACLVWSSPLPGDTGRPVRYIDLMGGHKPHLLIKSINNLGAETRVHYASSTKFYLADKAAGMPWITKLAFPVHVVVRVETHDVISRNRFVTRHAYHHGHFDGVEREFRGFGMVEQWDTEELAALTASGDLAAASGNIDAASYVPPVYTKTWFHTGIYLGRDRVSDFFAGEYYREPALTDNQARQLLLDDTVLPAGLTAEEEREAGVALKGSMLHQEVYALDGSAIAGNPYTVAEQNFTVTKLQPRGHNRYTVFFTHPREAINYYYERNPSDPRTTHTLTLEVDDFGNVLKEATVGYGRRQPDPNLSPGDSAKQTQTLITYTENSVTNAVDASNDYRTPLPCETSTYEITGLTLTSGSNRFTIDEMLAAGANASPIDYEVTVTSGLLQKRLIKRARTLYRPDDLGVAQNDPLALLPLGVVEPRALTGQSYKMAFTPGLVTSAYGVRATDPMLLNDGRYVQSESDLNWWIPSHRIFYSPVSADTPAQELAHATQHFFFPQRYRDPFHTNTVPTESFVSYDAYDLLVLETRDALDNRVTADNDYRVLQPSLVTDPNGNCTAAAFEALGMVVGTAVMGKPLPAAVEGDTLTGFEADLTEAVILAHLAAPLTNPQDILAGATTRLVYDLFAYYRTKNQANPQPAVVYTLLRETHASNPVPPNGLRFQHRFSYSDGFGREIQKKIQAEPGPAPSRDIDGKIIVGADGQPVMTANDINPRWAGSGWTVFNNKGKPVRQYEPFFTDTQGFEFDIRIGVSPVLFYDPVGRVVATLHPNHAWEKVVFNPWRQETWDVNDTVLVADPKFDPDAGDFFSRLPAADYSPTWYAQRQSGALGSLEQDAANKASAHANTPTVAHFDSLGRPFLTIADNASNQFYSTRVILDIAGSQREVIDADNRVVMRYDYDMLGKRIHQASMEAGERWMLNDVAGKPLYAWDSRGHQFRTAYDPLRRPTDSFLKDGLAAEIAVGRIIYGETQPSPEANNLRGKAFQLFDQAGVITSDQYDFKGNLLQSQRQLAHEYKTTLDWSVAVPLETGAYTGHTSYDALNRPTELTSPDNSVIRHSYNEASLLDRVDTNLQGVRQNGQPVWTPFVTNIDYDAKGQRELIDYGNGVRTTYTYDPLTFHLVQLLTLRGAGVFQSLHYTYDPVGNITQIRDDAQQTIYFLNQRVEPSADYTYDAIYRLIQATGREHLGQVGPQPEPTSYDDNPRVGLLHPGDGNAMGTYVEQYLYDAVGNSQQMIHRGSAPVSPGWTRTYAYSETSQLESSNQSNRLSSTTIGATTEIYSSGGNGYDAHGNMLRMPQLQIMQWDFKDELQMTQRQAVNADDTDGVQRQGERTWYVYDAGGQRVRKVTELANGQVKDERIYLGGFEIYSKPGANPLVRETLHIMDDKRRIALVETRTQGTDGSPAQLIRYEFGNHLGSASLELDDSGAVISYEEYYPYGSTSYQAVRNQTETPRRYRYSGKEKDEESGLYYHDARYFACWLGRWVSVDPIPPKNGSSSFVYAGGNPIRFVDLDGRQPTVPIAHPEPSGAGGGNVIYPLGDITKQVFTLPEVEISPPSHFWDVAGEVLGIGLSVLGAVALATTPIGWLLVAVAASEVLLGSVKLVEMAQGKWKEAEEIPSSLPAAFGKSLDEEFGWKHKPAETILGVVPGIVSLAKKGNEIWNFWKAERSLTQTAKVVAEEAGKDLPGTTREASHLVIVPVETHEAIEDVKEERERNKVIKEIKIEEIKEEIKKETTVPDTLQTIQSTVNSDSLSTNAHLGAKQPSKTNGHVNNKSIQPRTQSSKARFFHGLHIGGPHRRYHLR